MTVVCPHCGHICGPQMTICPQCGSALPSEEPNTDADDITVGDDLALLCRTSDMSGAEILAQGLEEQGIPFLMNPGPIAYRMMPLEFGQQGIRVYVPKHLLGQAKAIAARVLSDWGA